MKQSIRLLMVVFSISQYAFSAITVETLTAQVEKRKAELISKKKNFISRSKISSPTLSLGGVVDITHAMTHDLTLEGSGILTDCEIEGDAYINGDAIITESTFGGTVTVDGLLASFTKSTMGAICCKGLSEAIYVELIDTEVKGDISFEGKKGYVIKDKNSKIGGLVKGGTVFDK